MSKRAQKISLIIISFLIVSIFISLLTYIGYCIKVGLKANVISEENITKLTDVADIKKRMKYHGCLVCWKDSEGTWWFNRNDKQCRLR